MKDIAIVWFRNDLRIHDNEALTIATKNADVILPVFIFDERIFKGFTRSGFRKTEVFRAKFIIESVINLKENLSKKGLDLYVRVGLPEVEIFELAKAFKTSWIVCNRERTSEEVFVQDELEKRLWTIGQELVYTRGKMLYYTSDLPFPVTHTPDVFTSFRKEVEKIIPVRFPLPEIEVIHQEQLNVDWGNVPTLEDFNFEIIKTDNELAHFIGGESAALKQLKNYIWEEQFITNYKESRNQMLGWNYSSKFSPWLASGCLSPKMIYHEIKKFENTIIQNDSTYWLTFELLWRDFFRLMGKKHGNCIFKLQGLSNQKPSYSYDLNLFEKWMNGNTGIPIIDANMKELNTTGYMSNRGRQLTASFLVKDLNIAWLIGAEYFESRLIDYDPCSNYGNWLYIAGHGNDPREDRYFNIISQAKKYDPNGDFVKFWIPELSDLDSEFVHQPHLSKNANIDYPLPIVDLEKLLA